MDNRSLLQEIELLHDRISTALGDPTRITILYLLFFMIGSFFHHSVYLSLVLF